MALLLSGVQCPLSKRVVKAAGTGLAYVDHCPVAAGGKG